MFLLVPLSKSTFFTRVVSVALVSHSCHSFLTRVALVLHSCPSCRTRVAQKQLLVLNISWSLFLFLGRVLDAFEGVILNRDPFP